MLTQTMRFANVHLHRPSICAGLIALTVRTSAPATDPKLGKDGAPDCSTRTPDCWLADALTGTSAQCRRANSRREVRETRPHHQPP